MTDTACIVVAGRFQPVVLRDGGRTPEPVGPAFATPRAAIDAAMSLRASSTVDTESTAYPLAPASVSSEADASTPLAAAS
jgi:hypothetical protein